MSVTPLRAATAAATAAGTAAAATAAGTTAAGTTAAARAERAVAAEGTRKTTPKRRRWLRLAVPYLVVLALIAVTAIAYLLEEPNQKNAAFLSPTSAEGIGGRTLAERLRARGITVDRFTRTSDALVAAHRGDTTLFIPAPDLLHSYYLRMLKLMPASTTVVVVRPEARTLARGYLPAGVLETRWAARAAAPTCGYPVAQAAGRAGLLRYRYEGEARQVIDRCYRSALVRVRHHATTLVLAGASDPFRNDRINELGNSTLAVGLLSGARRVVWLDVHGPEPGPRYLDRPGLDPSPAPADLGSVGSPDPDFPVADPSGAHRDGRPQIGAQRRRGSGKDTGPTLFDLFPATGWTVLALALLAGLLAAVARARRLGAPVAEPLPVLVRSTETVTGRGRLYQRSRDRGAALAVLRVAARGKLARLLDQPSEVDRETLVAAVAAHTRRPVPDVDALLYGPPPEDDAGLVAAAAALDSLIAAVTRVPEGPEGPEGEKP
jgi:hypothetical protein